jgi:hypothetical protein
MADFGEAPVNPFRHGYVFFIVDGGSKADLTACAAEVIAAPNDMEAIEIAESVFMACDDAFESYGLWQADRMIKSTDHRNKFRPGVCLSECQQYRDQQILLLLRSLHASYPILSRSRKLPEEIKRLQLAAGGG